MDVVGLCAEDALDGAASSHFSTVADAAGGEPYALTSAAGPTCKRKCRVDLLTSAFLWLFAPLAKCCAALNDQWIRSRCSQIVE